MKIDIHADVHIHMVESGRAPQWAVELQASINELRSTIMATFDDVIANVTALSSKEDSLIALCAGISQQLKDALSGVTLPPAVQAKIDAINDSLTSEVAKVTAAVAANTPAA